MTDPQQLLLAKKDYYEKSKKKPIIMNREIGGLII